MVFLQLVQSLGCSFCEEDTENTVVLGRGSRWVLESVVPWADVGGFSVGILYKSNLKIEA